MRIFCKLPIALLSLVAIGTSPLNALEVRVPRTYQIAAALSGPEIGRMGKQTTVFIQGVANADNFGSGVIIAKSGRTYTVLTAYHVVSAQDQYSAASAEGGMNYPLKNIRRVPNVDLAVAQFDSDENLQVAQLGNSEQVQQLDAVYVAGFPKPGRNIQIPQYMITPGQVTTVVQRGAKDGYGLAYSNLTRAGMSGGPVFNDQGQVVAIHGRAEGEADTGSVPDKPWVNLGIPVSPYKTIALGGASGTQVATTQSSTSSQSSAQEDARKQQQAAAARKQQEAEAKRLAQQQEEARKQQQAAEARKQQEAEAQRVAQQQQEARKQQQAATARKQQEEAEAQRLAQQQEDARKQQQSAARKQQAAEVKQEQVALAPTAQSPATAAPKSDPLSGVRPLEVALAAPTQKPAVKKSSSCRQVRINAIVTQICDGGGSSSNNESASVSEPDTPEKFVSRGNQRSQSGSVRKGIEDYTQAIAMKPDYATAYFNRGYYFYKQGDSAKAQADFQKAAELFEAQGLSSELATTKAILAQMQR
jgi:tetratricopeptide (TPR) repeat protein